MYRVISIHVENNYSNYYSLPLYQLLQQLMGSDALVLVWSHFFFIVTTPPLGPTHHVDPRLALQGIDPNLSYRTQDQVVTACPVKKLLNGEILSSSNGKRTNNLHKRISEN